MNDVSDSNAPRSRGPQLPTFESDSPIRRPEEPVPSTSDGSVPLARVVPKKDVDGHDSGERDLLDLVSLELSLTARLKLGRIDLVDLTEDDPEPSGGLLNLLQRRGSLLLEADLKRLVLGERDGREGVLSSVKSPAKIERARKSCVWQ